MDATTKAAMTLLVVVVALLSNTQLSSPTVELPNGYCGRLVGGEFGQCDAGRCCGSVYYYCGTGDEYCSPENCVLYCPPSVPLNQSDHQVRADDRRHHDETTEETRGVEVLARRLDNETIDRYYLDRHITDHDDVVDHRDHDMTTAAAAPKTVVVVTSASLSSSSAISCGPSLLSRLPEAARQKYSWAALGVSSSSGNNVTDGPAICGRCLKVARVGAGGVRARQVMVRVVHVSNVEALELDTNTFRRLGVVDGRESSTYDGLLVKYQFENC